MHWVEEQEFTKQIARVCHLFPKPGVNAKSTAETPDTAKALRLQDWDHKVSLGGTMAIEGFLSQLVILMDLKMILS